IEDRKALLRDVVGAVGCPRLVTVEAITNGTALFEAVRQIGGEGIVSKRADSPYRDGAWARLAEDEGQRGRRVCDHRLHRARGGRGRRAAQRPCWCRLDKVGFGLAGKVTGKSSLRISHGARRR